jgi:hypothetical protein
MTTLKAHNKKLGDYNEIDKFLLVPKKLWDEIPEGEAEISLNGKRVKTRVYDIPCNCVAPDHHHRLVDLRSVWDEMKFKEGDNVKIEK